MDFSQISSALNSLKEEREHIDEYLQNAATKKKELDKKLNIEILSYKGRIHIGTLS